MVKFPDPPRMSQLRVMGPELSTLARGACLYRIFFRGGLYPTDWSELRHVGPTSARFDHHATPRGRQGRGILYAAMEGTTCVAEVFQDRRSIDVREHEPWIVGFELARDVVVLDLTGNWPTRAGASTAIHSGNRARARRWSAAIYEAFPAVEGLLYCSSMDANKPLVALYERAESAIPATPFLHRSLGDPLARSLLDDAAKRFRYFVRG